MLPSDRTASSAKPYSTARFIFLAYFLAIACLGGLYAAPRTPRATSPAAAKTPTVAAREASGPKRGQEIKSGDEANQTAGPCAQLGFLEAFLPTVPVGGGFQFQFKAGGGRPPYTFSAQNLPSVGLILTSDGRLFGSLTPPIANNGAFSVTVQDSSSPPCEVTRQFVLQGRLVATCPPEVVTTTITGDPLPDGVVGNDYDQTVIVPVARVLSGPLTTYVGPFNPNLTLTNITATTGGTIGFRISGRPNAPGDFTVNVQLNPSPPSSGTGGAINATCQAVVSYQLRIRPAGECVPILVTPNGLPQAVAGTSYRVDLAAFAGASPYTFAVTEGTLPPGITLTGNQLRGTPVETGSFPFTLTVTDSNNCKSTVEYGINVTSDPNCPVIRITPDAPLPTPAVRQPYSVQLRAAGGDGNYTFGVSAGALPDGLTLSSTGLLAGTPRRRGTFSFTITAADAVQCQGIRPYRVTVESDPNCAQIGVAPATLPPTAVGLTYTQALNGTGGRRPYRFEISGGSLPPGFVLTPEGDLTGISNAVGSATFTVTATDADECSGSRQYTLVTRDAFDTAPPSVALLNPDRDQIFANDTAIPIRWNAVDNVALAGFDIFATDRPLVGTGDTFPIRVATGLPADARTFNWTPGAAIASDTVFLRIVARDTNDNTAADVSRFPFAVRVRPTIRRVEYFCAELKIFGVGFNPRSLITLNGGLLSPDFALVTFAPQPAPDGSQILSVIRKGKGPDPQNPATRRGKWDDRKGAPNTLVIDTDGLTSRTFTEQGTGLNEEPKVRFTSPSSTTPLRPGDTVTISWEITSNCPIQTQQLLFADGNNEFDDVCFASLPPDRERRDVVVANLNGSVRSFTWTVPQIFRTFGRFRLRAESIEGSGQSTTGLGDPRNEPKVFGIFQPTRNEQLNLQQNDGKITIQFTARAACPFRQVRGFFRFGGVDIALPPATLNGITGGIEWNPLSITESTPSLRAALTLGNVQGGFFLTGFNGDIREMSPLIPVVISGGAPSSGDEVVRISSPSGPVQLTINDPDLNRRSLAITVISNSSDVGITRYEVDFFKEATSSSPLIVPIGFQSAPQGQNFFNREITFNWTPQLFQFPDPVTQGTIVVTARDTSGNIVGRARFSGVTVLQPR